MLIKLTGGKVYDPANKVSGEVRDIYVENGRIVATRPNARADATYDVKGRVVMLLGSGADGKNGGGASGQPSFDLVPSESGNFPLRSLARHLVSTPRS